MSTTSPLSMITPITTALRTIRDELAADYLEREQVITGMILGLVARQHVLLVGPPGTAKSALARALAERLSGGLHYELLMTKFTTPEEVFGPVSLSGLQEDRYARILDGRLAQANTAMIDEVGKAGSAILNSMLGIMADRVYHNDGHTIPCPLITMVGATNELPEGEELAALYDRFMLRYEVKPLSDAAFPKLLQLEAAGSPATTVSIDQLGLLHQALPTVVVPAGIIEGLGKLRADLRAKGLLPSDRRWRAVIGLMRASALFHGRDVVNEDDFDALTHVLWDRLGDQGLVIQAVGAVGNPLKAKATELLDRATELHEEAARHFGASDADVLQKAAMQANSKLKGIITELNRLIDSNRDRDVSRLEEVVHQVKSLNADVVRRGFGL